MSEHQCGPHFASEFFEGVRAAAKASGLSSKYLISCVDHETDLIGVDFEKQVGVTLLSNGQLVTSFVPREDVANERNTRAYKWLGNRPIGYIKHELALHDFGGPENDADFFAAIQRLRNQHFSTAWKYAITSRQIFVAGLGLSGDDKVVEGTIKDGRVYHILKPGEAVAATCTCCTWSDEDGSCTGTWCDQ